MGRLGCYRVYVALMEDNYHVNPVTVTCMHPVNST